MKQTFRLFILIMLMGIQVRAQSPLPVFTGNAEPQQAETGYFTTPRNPPEALSLPFFEDWESGTFIGQNWQTEGSNWKINAFLGNPWNCANFDWKPVQSNYVFGLISTSLDATSIEDGDILLSFDFMIDDRFDTVETEKFFIKIYADSSWHTVDSVIAMGDLSWQHFEYDISQVSIRKVFQIGFFAVGKNSVNIDGWFIDNIAVEHFCYPPELIDAQVTGFWGNDVYVTLDWIVNLPPIQNWISYNDGTFEYEFASADGGAGLAQYFTPTTYPCKIKEIKYFNSSYGQFQQQCTVWILKGDGETVLSGPYYVEDGPSGNWVSIETDEVIVESGGFMIATFNSDPGGPYIGVDDSFYDGSLYFGEIGDFQELGQSGSFYVGSHEVLVEIEGEVNTLFSSQKQSDRNVKSFNIWRDDELIEENYTDSVYYDTIYNHWCWYTCYQVQTVYDNCISELSESDCVFTTGNDEYKDNMGFFISPNPTTGLINISGMLNNKLLEVQILDIQGKYLKSLSFDSKSSEINVSDLKPGIYIVKIQAEQGSITKKLIKY